VEKLLSSWWQSRYGLEIAAPGLGCVGFSGVYGVVDDTESLVTIRRGIDLGGCYLDTADDYGPPARPGGHNEELIGKAIAGRRDDVVLATKFGTRIVGTRRESDGFAFEVEINGRPENVKASCDASLRRLGTDRIDLYLMHSIDPHVSIEETVGAMAELVDEGKVRHLGLCESTGSVLSVGTLERAVAVHPIAAVQCEWSLWSRDVENGIVQAARRLGAGIIAFGPLGRGFLTGTIKSVDDLPLGDFRRSLPRFQGSNFKMSLELLDHLRRMAIKKSCTPAQLALAWLIAQGDDVLPIPGARNQSELDENVEARTVALTEEDLAILDHLAPRDIEAEGRYPDGSPHGDSAEGAG
jgi:aryl-alcohol dehydrogenase-like predicted oxidoreductase